ncbi:MAG: GNAT family N-acetyltransferase [Anaerolineae bacterium]|nr:GNAT family N-acetyltransferase [Anaerolineae bacterium]MCA9896158.1 GNAT family N-acetyltransferase [Anaerolineae bacterium]
MFLKESHKSVQLRDLQPADVPAVRDLILAGLEDRFGFLLDGVNPDLDDIYANYVEQDASFIVMACDGHIVGCGALIKENDSDIICRIVRVSVTHEMRGQGLGRMISEHLIDIARERGFERIEVETNSDWTSALTLYKSLGFIEYKRVYVPEYDFIEVYMAMII